MSPLARLRGLITARRMARVLSSGSGRRETLTGRLVFKDGTQREVTWRLSGTEAGLGVYKQEFELSNAEAAAVVAGACAINIDLIPGDSKVELEGLFDPSAD